MIFSEIFVYVVKFCLSLRTLENSEKVKKALRFFIFFCRSISSMMKIWARPTMTTTCLERQWTRTLRGEAQRAKSMLSSMTVTQVWPLTQFFCSLFEKYITLVGKTLFSSVPPSNSPVSALELCFLSKHSDFQGPSTTALWKVDFC